MNRKQFLELPVEGRVEVLSNLLQFTKKKSSGLDKYIEGQLKANSLESETLVSQFEAIVAKHSTAVALRFKGTCMSYAELNRRANQVAHYLLSNAQQEKYIGLFMDPSFDTIVGLLGILKSGRAYVPIDTKNAPDRIWSIVDDLNLKMMFTTRQHLDRIDGFKGDVVCLEKSKLFNGQSESNPLVSLRGKNTAYVIYTSGSTGKPKGVPICHYNVVHLFRSADTLFEFSHKDVWTFFHSVSFDFSVWEIWGALLKGGTLVVVPFSVSRNYSKFAALLQAENVTVLSQTPTAFRLLIQVRLGLLSDTDRYSLRYVVLGGEALNIECLRPWFDRFGDESTKIINMYGITETTVHVTYRQVVREDLSSKESLVGWPLPGVAVYILDGKGVPVQPGDVGEMYIGGLGLSHGYLNREELSSLKFVSHPFLSVNGARLYRSGDLGRYLDNGELCYVGRIDSQVQIRGFRVELGEIENAVLSIDFIRDAVVYIENVSQNGDSKIVVAYQTKNDTAVTHRDLRLSLKNKLPEYMLPDLSICVEEFPMNKNGKFDREKTTNLILERSRGK